MARSLRLYQQRNGGSLSVTCRDPQTNRVRDDELVGGPRTLAAVDEIGMCIEIIDQRRRGGVSGFDPAQARADHTSRT